MTKMCECCKRQEATQEMVAKDKTVILLCDECRRGYGDLVHELGFKG